MWESVFLKEFSPPSSEIVRSARSTG